MCDKWRGLEGVCVISVGTRVGVCVGRGINIWQTEKTELVALGNTALTTNALKCEIGVNSYVFLKP